MSKKTKRVIRFGYKVSEGDHNGFACFLQHLKPSKQHEEHWTSLVVDVITELPIDSGKKVLKAMLTNSVH